MMIWYVCLLWSNHHKTINQVNIRHLVHSLTTSWKHSKYWGGWKVHMVFFHKIKDMFFIFTNNFVDLDILSMSAICHVVLHWLFSINVLTWSLSTSVVHPTAEHHPVGNLQHKTSQTTSDTFDQSQHLLHTLHKSFLTFQLCFCLSWNNKE